MKKKKTLFLTNLVKTNNFLEKNIKVRSKIDSFGLGFNFYILRNYTFLYKLIFGRYDIFIQIILPSNQVNLKRKKLRIT